MAQAGSGGVISETKDESVFLGNEFIELGVGPDGGFGADTSAPASFDGNSRGFIGMYADFDGFESGEDYQYDYFLPGEPEERFSVGYRRGEKTFRASNGNSPGENIPTDVTDASDSSTARAQVESTFNEELDISQTYELGPSNKYYKVDVTMTNTDSQSMSDVRYQRSFDPDNGYDVGCDYTTKNTVLRQQPEDGAALVKAEIADFDQCDISDISSIPIFYYTDSDAARVSTGESYLELVPDTPPYGSDDYDSAPNAPRTITEDAYIALTFEESTLDPGESVSYTYYVGLTGDIDETLGNVGDPPTKDDDDDPVLSDVDVSAESGGDGGAGASAEGGEITTSFESDENPVNMEVRVEGPDGETTLERDDFSGDTFEGYESTFEPDEPGEYTLTITDARTASNEDLLGETGEITRSVTIEGDNETDAANGTEAGNETDTTDETDAANETETEPVRERPGCTTAEVADEVTVDGEAVSTVPPAEPGDAEWVETTTAEVDGEERRVRLVDTTGDGEGDLAVVDRDGDNDVDPTCGQFRTINPNLDWDSLLPVVT